MPTYLAALPEIVITPPRLLPSIFSAAKVCPCSHTHALISLRYFLQFLEARSFYPFIFKSRSSLDWDRVGFGDMNILLQAQSQKVHIFLSKLDISKNLRYKSSKLIFEASYIVNG